jgi:hypothetical protein
MVSSSALYALNRASSSAKVNKKVNFFIIRLLLIIKLYIEIRSKPSRKMMDIVRDDSFSIIRG